MAKYLTEFATEQEYNSFKNTKCPYVNVSHIVSTDEVKYFKDDTMDETTPFTVKLLSMSGTNPSTGNYEIPVGFQVNNRTGNQGGTISYKINNGNWITHKLDHLNDGEIYIFDDMVGINDEVQFICKTNGIKRILNYFDIYGTGTDCTLKLSGNIMSTIWGDAYKYSDAKTVPFPYEEGGNYYQWPYYAAYCFFHDFARYGTDCSDLVLPTRDLSTNIFRDMFNLDTDGNYPEKIILPPTINAPLIPALGANGMFYHAANMTKVPEINSYTVHVNCGLKEFCSGCTSLVNDIDQNTGEPEVNWTSIKTIYFPKPGDPDYDVWVDSKTFNSIFSGCTSLKYAPKMDLSTVPFENNDASSLYFNSAFNGCTSLIECDWVIPYTGYSTTQAFGSMFAGCQSMTKSITLVGEKFTDLLDFGNMFAGCQSLQEIKFPCLAGNFWFTDTTNMPQTGTIYVHDDSVYFDQSSEYYGQIPGGLPSGWIVKPWSEYPSN